MIIINDGLCLLGLLNPGAPKARARELTNWTTAAIYKHVTTMMTEHHSALYLMLVILDRWQEAGGLTSQELSLFVNGVETGSAEDDLEMKVRIISFFIYGWLQEEHPVVKPMFQ